MPTNSVPFNSLSTIVWICCFIAIECQLLTSSITGVTDRPASKLYTKETYPNPWIESRLCNRIMASYVCDPDKLLTTVQLRTIDDLIWKIGRNSSCLCDQSCNLGKYGIPVVTALMKDPMESKSQLSSLDEVFQEQADYLRKKWKFGICDSDILILLTSKGGIISAGEVAKGVLKDVIKFESSDKFPTKQEDQYRFILDIIYKVSTVLIGSKRVDWPKYRPDMPSIASKTSTTSTLATTIVKSPSFPTAFEPIEEEIEKNEINLQMAGVARANTFIAAPQNDEFEAPKDDKINTSLVFIIVGSIAVLLVCLIALFLIIWYFRTKTGNIEPVVNSKKPQPVEKTSTEIKSVKYEPCDTEEPGLPV